jgi:hypothetical protein
VVHVPSTAPVGRTRKDFPAFMDFVRGGRGVFGRNPPLTNRQGLRKMAKRKSKRQVRAERNASFRRSKILRIARHLAIPNAHLMTTRDVVSTIALEKRIGLGPVHRINAEAVILWFQKNEAQALLKPAGKISQKAIRDTKKEFYKSWEWRTLRMKVLKKYGPVCQCCGARAGQTAASGDPVRICVDHIQPLAKRWDLRLDEGNCQVLCDECNQGKGAWDETDWRDDESILDDEPMSPIEVQLGERMH